MRSISSERSAGLMWLSILKEDTHAHVKSNRKSEKCGKGMAESGVNAGKGKVLSQT